MTLDASTLRKWRELSDAASPGPWVQYLYDRDNSNDPMPIVNLENGLELLTVNYRHPNQGQHIKDATFIAEARSALPLLIDAYEKLQAENDRLSADLEFANDVVKERESWAAMRLKSSNKIDAENDRLLRQIEKHLELFADLDMVLKTAMHNGHHDLIQRVSDVVKGIET